MNHLGTISKILSGLAAVALLAASLPAAAVPEGVDDLALASTAQKPANSGSETPGGESCAAAGSKEACRPAPGFPPLDMAASLFSAMTGCSRDGI